MRVNSWQRVILSWANALKLSEEPFRDVLDLTRGDFFVRLLNKIKSGESIVENVMECEVYTVIESFLKEQYGGFRLLGYWDSDEVTLVSSVFLLWSSLQSQDFRTPLYNLNNIVQLKIHAFLEQFIETPQHHINRQIVMEAVLDIPSDDETEDDSSSFISSPRNYSTPKRSTQCSPGFLALSEVRSLRGKVELLSFEKQHLQDELDVTKSQLKETIAQLNWQKNECSRLALLLSRGDEDKDISLEKGDGDHFLRHKDEYVSLKSDYEEMKEVHERLRLELESAIEDNNNLSKKLKMEEITRMTAVQRCAELESKVSSLNSRTEELENLVTSLKKTCEEQRNIILEKRNSSQEESFHYSEGETLGSIIDIKYSELQEELQLKSEMLAEKSKEIQKLLNEKLDAENTIKKLTEEMKSLRSSTFQDSESQCNECQITKEELATLNKDFNNKCSEFLKLQEKLAQKTAQLKVISNSKLADETRISELKTNVSSLIVDHGLKFNELREEIVALKCDLCEKNNNIEYFKDEIEFLSSCLNDRNREIKTLEHDYSKINSSKDKEIAQLMVTIDHLNREVKRLEDQLQGQYFKNEKLVQSAFQWRQKMTLGNSANEELARELISLHETLEWKNFKLKEFSLQIDQIKSELSDKSTMNKELHERLSFMSERNKEYHKELQNNKSTITQLQSKIVTLEFNEKKLNQDVNKNVRMVNLLESELRELRNVLNEKFVQIDLELESHLFKGSVGVQDILKFSDFLIDTLKENKKQISILNQVIIELENDNAEKAFDVEHHNCDMEHSKCGFGEKSIEIWKKENQELKDKIKRIENEFENSKVKLQISLNKLEKAKDEVSEKEIIISELSEKLEALKIEKTEKMDLINHLMQNVNLYEHEKNILEKKLKSLSVQTGETQSVKAENIVLKNDVVVLEKQLEEERENLKTVEEKMNVEENLSYAFEQKLLVLQAKMKQKYEENVNSMVEDYTRKIEQLKSKIKKDCLHIEQLSSDLWETSDRLVLAQQESEALRSQLRITRQMLSDHQMQKRGVEDSHSFMWLGGPDAASFVDEMVTTVTTKRTLQAARVLPDDDDDDDDDDEDFNQQCLEDLKAGICRIPSERLSCPPASSSVKDMDCGFLRPPEKPRKLKGTITYRKPGPPTPSINAARHSLPGNEKLEIKKGLREHNPNAGQVRNRLSQLFGSINLSKAKTVQESPKVKRRGFFQRTFGNRENIPPK